MFPHRHSRFCGRICRFHVNRCLQREAERNKGRKLESHAGAAGNDETGTLSEGETAMTYKNKKIIRMMGWMNSKGSIIKIWYADHTTELINDAKVIAREGGQHNGNRKMEVD